MLVFVNASPFMSFLRRQESIFSLSILIKETHGSPIGSGMTIKKMNNRSSTGRALVAVVVATSDERFFILI